MRTWLLITTAAATASLFFAAACTVGSDCDFGLCSGATTSPDGSNPGDGGDGGIPVDPCVDTPSDPKCLDETGAIFVSKAGTGDGSRANPVGSVGAALQKIDDKRRRIYVCEGTYPEDIGFTPAQNGVSLIGGFDCAWTPKKDAKPVLGSSATPMSSKGTTGLALVDIAVEAKDATDGGSSIALFVSGGSVALKGVRLVAGNGSKGEGGTLKPNTYKPSSDLAGNSGTAGGGGEAKTITCDDGSTSVGGAGGNAGTAGSPGKPDLDGGAGGSLAACEGSNTGGGNGGPGSSPTPGQSATTLGKLTADGWIPESGMPGKNGGPGQGGGGGGGANGTGGSGGAGGCGGAGGGAGKGGGASVALASLNAAVQVERGELSAKNGGDGGNGILGQDGQTPGGSRGTGFNMACNGGNGGPGGKGGAGGGGAGGVSTAILYVGSAPITDAPTQTRLKAGSPGQGGRDGTLGTGNVGVQPDAVAILEL